MSLSCLLRCLSHGTRCPQPNTARYGHERLLYSVLSGLQVLSFPHVPIAPPCALPRLLPVGGGGGGSGSSFDVCGHTYVEEVAAATGERMDSDDGSDGATDELECLGDIFVCPEVVLRDAERDGATFNQRLPVVLVHGYGHLLGYTHHDMSATRMM